MKVDFSYEELKLLELNLVKLQADAFFLSQKIWNEIYLVRNKLNDLKNEN